MSDTHTPLLNPLTGLPIDDNQLSSLSDLASRQVDLEQAIEAAEAKTNLLKEELKRVSTQEIPAKMDELGLMSLKLTNGRVVTLKPFYSTKLLSNEAYTWLDKNGHGGIIKTQLIRDFLRTEREAALEYQKAHPEFTLKESIHHQTLAAFTKEIYADNGSLPEELFQVYSGQIAKIK
jgi:hypothetical protein